MIDWWLVGSASLWITGLAVLLSALSYQNWLAHETGTRLRDRFVTRSWGVPYSVGMTMFCTGLAAAREAAWWERAIWTALALFFAWQLIRHCRQGVPTR